MSRTRRMYWELNNIAIRFADLLVTSVLPEPGLPI